MDVVAGRGSRAGIGRWLYRTVVLITGFFICSGVLIAMRLGLMEGDPAPWAMALVTAGLPTFLAFVLYICNIISETTELKILVASFWICIYLDAGYFAFSDALGREDVWMKISLAPIGYVVWHSALHATDVRAPKRSKLEQCGPLLLLTCSVLVRSSWDTIIPGMLLTTCMVLIVFQVCYVLLHEFHAETYRLGEQMALERRLQDSLLSAAFDATMHVQKALATSSEGKECQTLVVLKSSESFTSLIGKDMGGRPLAECICHGVEHLLEVVISAEETYWSQESPKRLSRALITCIDTKGYELDCEVLALARAPSSETDAGGLICGLRKAGEKRLTMNQDLGNRSMHLESSPFPSGKENRSSASTPLLRSKKKPNEPLQSAWNALSFWLGLPQRTPSDEEDTLHTDVQTMAWQTLCQVPAACVFWLSRSNLVVKQVTPTAADMFGITPGQHIMGLFQYANHATLLRKAVQVMSEKLASEPQTAGFKVGGTMNLPLLSSALTLKDARVTLIFLPGVQSVSLDPAVFMVVRLDVHSNYIDIDNRVASVVGTVYPDDSASQCDSSGDSELVQRRLWEQMEQNMTS